MSNYSSDMITHVNLGIRTFVRPCARLWHTILIGSTDAERKRAIVMPIEQFRQLHKGLGHLVIGMLSVPASLDSPRVPAWSKCLTCNELCDE